MDKWERVYIFQGLYFARYTQFNYPLGLSGNVPDFGFPKLISSNFPISSWVGHFTATAFYSWEVIFIFRGYHFSLSFFFCFILFHFIYLFFVLFVLLTWQLS